MTGGPCTEPSAVAPGQRRSERPRFHLTRRYRARFCERLIFQSSLALISNSSRTSSLITPKAFANSSPGLEPATTLGNTD